MNQASVTTLPISCRKCFQMHILAHYSAAPEEDRESEVAAILFKYSEYKDL